MQIGSVLFDTETMTIAAVNYRDTVYSEATMEPEVISRWLSGDPLRQYASPYVGMGNSPVNQVDPDGAFSYNQGVNKNEDIVFDDGLNDGNIFLVNDGYEGGITDLSTLQANSTQISKDFEFIGTQIQLQNFVLSQFDDVGMRMFPHIIMDNTGNRLSVSVTEGKRIGNDYGLRLSPPATHTFTISYVPGSKTNIYSNVYDLRNTLEHEKFHDIQAQYKLENISERFTGKAMARIKCDRLSKDSTFLEPYIARLPTWYRSLLHKQQSISKLQSCNLLSYLLFASFYYPVALMMTSLYLKLK